MTSRKFKDLFIYSLLSILPRKIIKSFKIFRFRLNYDLEYLIKKGVKINTIYDIGAFHGEWSSFLNKTSLKKRIFYLFEANEKHENVIKSKGFIYFIGVLSDKIKKVKFYTKNHTGDSYFLEQTNMYESNIKPKIKTTTTIDKIIKHQKFKLPDFIKIDTQGSEIDILKGAKNTLSKCNLIFLECPIVEYNLNSPNLNEYVEYLNSINFVPFDICEIHYIDNILVQIDILFIKKKIFKKIYKGKKILNLLN
jgi:FkbM family methyltransferase|tara:strand:+ start:480 stop:1232 length:753 start_codon:yes stop_codon:yes gene_type:complete